MATAVIISISRLIGILLVVGVTLIAGVLMFVGIVPIDSVLIDVVTLMTVKRCQ